MNPRKQLIRTVGGKTPEALVIEQMFMIADKDGEDVPFVLNTAQARVDRELTGRDCIPKARQEGVSSYQLARFTAACLGKRNVRAAVISHEREATERMLAKVHYFLENIRGPKPKIKSASKEELVFQKTGSRFFIGTAGSRKFGRGDTITHLHCSEVAFWEDPRELTRGLFQAVPASGEIAIESTGNGSGTWYHSMCLRAQKGQSRYNLIFLPWDDFDEYKFKMSHEAQLEFLRTLDEDFEEETLYNQGIGVEQLAWRRAKLEEMDYDLQGFKQEYPLTLDEAFQTSGTTIFNKINYVKTKKWKRSEEDKNFHFLEGHPHPLRTYIIGADTAAGLGSANKDADSSVLEVFSIEDLEQVGEWVSNKFDPYMFARKCVIYGKMFNGAFLVPEMNNHGILVMQHLKENYNRNLLYRNKKPPDNHGAEEAKRDNVVYYGWQTKQGQGPMSRFAAMGRLRTALATEWTIHSEILKSELSTIIENPDTGKLEAAPGCHDDTVMACVCVVMGIGQAVRKLTAQKPRTKVVAHDPFSLDQILNDLAEQNNPAESPFPDQV